MVVAPVARAATAPGLPNGPSVQQVVEFTRIIQPLNHDSEALQNQISPDGAWAFIVTRRADVAADLNRFDLQLLEVSPQQLATQAHRGHASPPRTVFTVTSRRDNDDADPSIRDARWVDARTIVLRARLQDRPFQVYAIDVHTRRLRQLTSAPVGLVAFDVSRDLRRVVYVAPVPNPPMVPGEHSVVVGNRSFWSVKFGQDDLVAQQRRYRYWVQDSGAGRPARPLGPVFAESSGRFPRVSVSPDGRWAVLPRYEPDRQKEWASRYRAIAELTARFGPGLTMDPLQYFSRPYSYVVRRMVAYHLDDGREQPILDAPDDSLPGTGQLRQDRVWSADGRSVIIAGTYLPTDDRGGAELGSQIIDYQPDTGQWHLVTPVRGRLTGIQWELGAGDTLRIQDGGITRRLVRQAPGRWQEAEAGALPEARQGWSLRVAEALDQPPDVVADGPGGRQVRLTLLNPQHDPATWGSMRPYAWKDAKGRSWDGGLMMPRQVDPAARRGLVIQTYGYSPSRFYLDGSNQYNGFTSGFAGRAFLREGLLVLAFPWGPTTGAAADERGAIGAFIDGVRGAVQALVADGLVDPQRVGIMGWSATGERVLNQITFSDLPIRAATILDGDANTLFSMTITYGVKDGIQSRKEVMNEGGPFGEALQRWVRNDPSLHTDCVRTALRIETYGPLVQNNWDIYALLRRQYKPVEMVVVPGGAHALSRPSERMLSLQGNVDWYRFWLQDEQRTVPLLRHETTEQLREQYLRWTQMADLKRADEAKPRCDVTFNGG